MRQAGACCGGVRSDVELGDSNLDASRGKLGEIGLEGRWNLSDDEVGLHTDTVDGNALGLEPLNEGEQRIGFGVDPVGVVVVDLHPRNSSNKNVWRFSMKKV